MITLYELNYTKADLEKAPEDERTIYFMLGEVANELGTLSKQSMFWVQAPISDDDIHSYARTASALTNLKLIAGRLLEAWNLIRSKEHASVYKKIAAELDDDGSQAFNDVRRYFKKDPNLVRQLRNKLAFHSDYQTVARAYSDFPDDETLTDYVAQHAGNTFYNSAHMITAFAIMRLTGLDNLQDALVATLDDVLGLSGAVERYAHGYANVFSNRYFQLSSPPSTYFIADAEIMSTVQIPYFLKPG